MVSTKPAPVSGVDLIGNSSVNGTPGPFEIQMMGTTELALASEWYACMIAAADPANTTILIGGLEWVLE